MIGTYKNKTTGTIYRVEQDTEPPDPRKEYDNVGTIVAWHSRYRLGDEQPGPDVSPNEWLVAMARKLTTYVDCKANQKRIAALAELNAGEAMALLEKQMVILPVYLYDHSGLAVSTERTGCFADQWDSMQIGFIYVMNGKARQEWSGAGWHKKAEAYLRSELATYNDFLTGNVYQYRSEDPDDIGCGGYYPTPNVPGVQNVADFVGCTAAELEKLSDDPDFKVEDA